MITIPAGHGVRWAVKAAIVIRWDWDLVGLYWKTSPTRILIYGTILPPFVLLIQELRIAPGRAQNGNAHNRA